MRLKLPSMMLRTTSALQSRNDGLQAARGVAALLVAFTHIYWLGASAAGLDIEWFFRLGTGGFGVFIFFVLSGLLMGDICLRTERTDSAPFRFAVARVRRLYPLYFLALCASFAIAWWVKADWYVSVPNVLLLPSAVPNGTLWIAYWSLVFEVMFYALITALLWLAGAIGRAPSQVMLPALAVWTLAIIVVSLMLGELNVQFSDQAYLGWARIIFSPYNLFFIAGCFLALLPPQGLSRAAIWILTVTCGIAAVVLPVFHNVPDLITLISYLVSSVGVTLIFLDWRPQSVPSRILTKIGDWSYGLYLFHMMGAYAATGGLYAFYNPTLTFEPVYPPLWVALPVVAIAGMLPGLLAGVLDQWMQALLKKVLRKKS